jgi:hypothetical protein
LYTAFISYRHVDPDRRWAHWLHRSLETYRVPQRLVAAGKPARVGRMFRDEEELSASADLSASIDQALTAARTLIVVCSPRTPDSRWVNEEIARFQEMGRADRVLALLIEGEPEQSFPPALRRVEPLAADVRPVEGERRRSLKKTALLKLLAAVLDVSYDDLRQREEERARRRLTWIASGAGIAAIAFFALAALAAFQWSRAENELRVSRAQNLANAAALASTERPGAQALGLVGPERPVLLALESLNTEPSVEGDRVLRNALARLSGFPSGIPIPDAAQLISLGANGRFALLGTDAGLKVLDTTTGRLRPAEPNEAQHPAEHPRALEEAAPCGDSQALIARSRSGRVFAVEAPPELLSSLHRDWVFGGAVLKRGCTQPPLAVLPHEWGIGFAFFSPDERALLTITPAVSRDPAEPAATALVGSTVRIWDVPNRSPLGFGAVPEGRLLSQVSLATQGDITDVAVSPEGNWLAMRLRALGDAEAERTYLLVWPLWPDTLRAEACKRLTRNLSPSEWASFVGFRAYGQTCPGLPAVSE